MTGTCLSIVLFETAGETAYPTLLDQSFAKVVVGGAGVSPAI